MFLVKIVNAQSVIIDPNEKASIKVSPNSKPLQMDYSTNADIAAGNAILNTSYVPGMVTYNVEDQRFYGYVN